MIGFKVDGWRTKSMTGWGCYAGLLRGMSIGEDIVSTWGWMFIDEFSVREAVGRGVRSVLFASSERAFDHIVTGARQSLQFDECVSVVRSLDTFAFC